MSDMNFKFSTDKQRKINQGGEKPDPQETLVRRQGRHQFNVKIDLKMGYLKMYSPPEGIEFWRYGVKDRYGNYIPPFTREYNQYKPVNCSFVASEVHPQPWARFTELGLYRWIEKAFGKYILDWNITEKDEPGLKQNLLFRHEGLMENNQATGQDKLNKNMFNIRPKFMYKHELDHLNKRLEIMGYKIKENDALMSTQKTINRPSKFYFEYGDY